MIIVCDASPLIALSLCNKLDLLDTLFKEVVIPEQVYHEAILEGKPEAGKIAVWAQGKVQRAEKQPLFQAINLSLDVGESEAITLYWEKSADFLLIDERRGRRIAAQNSIKNIGTLGILLLAKEKGLIDMVKPFWDQLWASPIRISNSLYQNILNLAGER
jgi:predicted nucleic acid-binding protein